MQYKKYSLIGILFVCLSHMAYADTDLAPDYALIKARIEPVGKVYVAGAVAPVASASSTKPGATSLADKAKEIVNSKCSVCHAAGLAGAPKFGDATAWKPRIAKGLEVLFTHVKTGFNAMPPKGTCVDCTDDELKAALNEVISKLGAK